MTTKPTPRSKAALVDLGDIETVHRDQRSHRSIGTAPGQAMQNSMLRVELEQWKGASPVRHLDPTTVVRSKWANRHEESFHDEDFLHLKEDIESSGGNVQPIKVRPLAGNTATYEVIFGHRRHQACLELGIPVLAMLADVGDQQMFVEMDRENRQRKDLRPYEQGMMYDHALKEGLFPSARKLSEATGIDLGNIGKALTLANLPAFVINAFNSPLDLQYRWATVLQAAITDRPEDVKAIAESIQKIKADLSPKEIFDRLIREEAVGDLDSTPHRVKVQGGSGQEGLIVVNPTSKSISVNLKNIDATRAVELEVLIKKFLS